MNLWHIVLAAADHQTVGRQVQIYQYFWCGFHCATLQDAPICCQTGAAAVLIGVTTRLHEWRCATHIVSYLPTRLLPEYATAMHAIARFENVHDVSSKPSSRHFGVVWW